jgi:signal transduction histidine kinase/ActR/RegA family two-component response regulator
MLGRRKQFWLRVALGLAVACIMGPSIGWPAVGLWLAVWCPLQAVESRWTRSAEVAINHGSEVRAAPALALVLIANAVFNTLGIAAIFSGNFWLLVCGIWLTAGSLLNAAASSGASTGLFLAGAAPAPFASLAVLVVAGRSSATPAQLVALALSSVLLLVAVYAIRGVGARSLLAAKEASASKGEFLANVSHEIRTPLNGVLGMAQVMAAGELSAEQRQRLDVIGRSGQALLSLLNDVLDLSKIEAGKLEIEVSDFDLEQLALDLVHTFEAAAAAKTVAVRAQIGASLGGFWQGDPARIRQILSNLLSNALKFTNEGEVRLSAHAAPGGIEVVVSDTGIGIPADRLNAIFDKYVQASAGTSRQFGGTGLGLSICRELATRMGGRLAAESTVGAGSAFRLWLPLERSERTAHEAAYDETEGLDLAGLRVLAAEDHPTNQAVLRLLLAQSGIELHVVGHGQAALEAWREGEWDLILMDVQMPVLDGPGAVRAIREEERRTARPYTPIIALTANAMKHQIAQYLACGMDGFVAKPLELALLLEAIAEVTADKASSPPARGAAASLQS